MMKSTQLGIFDHCYFSKFTWFGWFWQIVVYV